MLHCSECLELCHNLIPCENCSNSLYCSKVCRRKAFVDYHRYECAVLRYFHIESDNIIRIAIRMTLKGAKECGTNDIDGDYKKCSKLFSGKLVDSPNFIFQIASVARIFYALKHNTDFFSEFDIRDNVLKSMLLRDLSCCIFNSTTILKWHLDDFRDVGTGVYPTFSFFNHACYENSIAIFFGNTVVVKARRRIKRGEQCFLNYGAYPFETTIERQQRLTQYQFICKCQACVQDWPILEMITNPSVEILFTRLARILQECTCMEIDRKKKTYCYRKLLISH